MNSAIYKLAATSLLLMGLAAGFLVVRGQNQRLGEPGLLLKFDPLADAESLKGRSNVVNFPSRVMGYESRPGSISESELVNLPGDTGFGRALYRDIIDGFEAQVSAVLMGTDRTSIHRPQQCLPWQGWTIANQQEVPVRFEHNGQEHTLYVQRIDAKTQRVHDGVPTDIHAVYVYWYIADAMVASTHAARHLQTMQALLTEGVLPRWAYVSYFAVCAPQKQDETFDRLTRLIAVTAPRFQRPGFLDQQSEHFTE
jgi:hypothetical protein